MRSEEKRKTNSVLKRTPSKVMRLNRLGSFHQTRLSFMRVLLRRLKNEQWSFKRKCFNINSDGVGHAVYCASGPNRSYSLVAFSHQIPDELRSDRVIAEQWDSTFALFDGVPTDKDIERLSKNVPRQEAGRISSRELTLSRANRSVRLWEHVIASLAAGHQPDRTKIQSVGYLMRTTAVYGSGKFGAADRQTIADREECKSPFQVEMLSVYLIRTFVRDLVQHMANVRGGQKTAILDPEISRMLGIGNSTGLGMAPFILNHPRLFNNWIDSREASLATVRSIKHAGAHELNLFNNLFDRASRSLLAWHTSHEIQNNKLKILREDIEQTKKYVSTIDVNSEYPWNNLYLWVEDNLSLEGQEFIASLLLEPYGHLVDENAHDMGSDGPTLPAIDGLMTIKELQRLVHKKYDWALTINWQEHTAQSRAWYVSEEKLEPRLGERFEEPIGAYEQPLAPGRDAMQLLNDIQTINEASLVAEFLLQFPTHRHTVRRVQKLAQLPYGEIRDNTIGADLLPIDMLRCKLSFFGAIHFDPRSDRWVRICMFANAPYPEELSSMDAEFWVYPE